jgi:hypothetical protein
MGGGRPVGWPPFHFALVVEDEIGAAEGAIVACRLVSHRNMRRDLAIDEPLQQPDRTISAVACEPLSRHGRDWTGPPYRRVVHLPAM